MLKFDYELAYIAAVQFMALTETQKKKIEEEESYRAEVKSKLSKKKKGIGVGGWIMIVLLTPFILVALIVGAINSSSPHSSANTTDERTQEQNVETKNGSYESFDGNRYDYNILYKQDYGKYAATFTPFLPRDDRSLVEAALEVFKVTYGDNIEINPQPLIEEREEGNVMKFEGKNGSFYLLPIKEDSGEIHSLIYWKE